MNTKRWLAIVVAVVLLFVSIGFRFTMELASGLFNELLSFDENYYEEEILYDGDFNSRIAVLNIDGVIMNDETASFLGQGYNHERLLTTIRDRKSVV